MGSGVFQILGAGRDGIGDGHGSGRGLVIGVADAVDQHLSDLHAICGQGRIVNILHRLAEGRIVGGVGIVCGVIVDLNGGSVIHADNCVAQCFLGDLHLEGHVDDLPGGDVRQVPGELAIGIGLDSGVSADELGALGNHIGNGGIGNLVLVVDHLNGVGKLVAHGDRTAILQLDGGVGGPGAGDSLDGVGSQSQAAIVAQQHGIVGVGQIGGVMDVHNGGCGVSGVFRLNGIVSRHNGGSGVGTLLDVPLACGILTHMPGCGLARGHGHRNIGRLLGAGEFTVCIGSAASPVEVGTGIVVGLSGNRLGASVGHVVIAVLDQEHGVLLVGVVAVIGCGIEGCLSLCPVVAALGCGAIPVVGEEIVGVGLSVIVHGALAVGGRLSGVVSGHDLLHVLGIDVAAQAHLVNDPGGVIFNDLGGVIAVDVSGDGNLLHGQQACRGTDDHGLLVGSFQGALNTDHEVQVLVIGVDCGITGGTVEEVRPANMGGLGVACLIGLDIGDGIVLGAAQNLHGDIFLAHIVLGAPPAEAVGALGINSGIGNEVIHIDIGLAQLQPLGKDALKGLIKLRISAALQIDTEGAALIEVAVGHDTLHVLHFHVFANGVIEVHIAGEVAGIGDLGGRGDSL